MSVICPPAILGPEMGATKSYGCLAFSGSFCWKGPMPIKFLVLGGGGGLWAREIGTICPFGVFEANPCGEANCGVVTFSILL